jgi:hypothetical protein
LQAVQTSYAPTVRSWRRAAAWLRQRAWQETRLRTVRDSRGTRRSLLG